MIKKLIYIFFVFCFLKNYAQTDQKVMARTFVKKGKILFRLLPKNSEVYNNITAKGLNLIRFDNNQPSPENIQATLSDLNNVRRILNDEMLINSIQVVSEIAL